MSTRFFLSSVLLFFVLGGLFLALVGFQFNIPLEREPTEQRFVVKKGDSLRMIAADLENEGLIRDKIWFVGYVLYQGWAAKLQAGQYILSPSLNIKQIAEKMAKGEAISQDVEITIPEGFTLKKIDARLAKAGLIEAGELIMYPKLEGYLFPDTYRFDVASELRDIVYKMKDNFDKKLDNSLRAEIKKQGKTVEEVVIMASILEKEVRTDRDRRIASGIFWRRLGNNYPLQSCATIAYILDEDKWRYSTEDTKVDSPYNSYQNVGLPKGPICNPGLSAIRAAINPQENDYNFFLSKPDGETVFSKTLDEHNMNKAKWLE